MAVRVPTTLATIKLRPSGGAAKVLKNTGCVAGAMMLGDLGCQAMEQYEDKAAFAWDHLRTLRMGLTGAFVMTPMSYSWNLFAERVAPGTSWRAVLAKAGVSIAVMPPMLAVQFTTLTLLEEGKTMDDVRRKLSRDFLPTLKVGMSYWPIIGMLNSRFVAVMNRPAFSSFAGVFWNVCISYQANNDGMDVGDVVLKEPLNTISSSSRAGDPAVMPDDADDDDSAESESHTLNSKAAEGRGGDAKKRTPSSTGGEKIVRRTSVVSM